jgi:hypothetical protein
MDSRTEDPLMISLWLALGGTLVIELFELAAL